jgi:ribosome biogenesis protein YTM1
MKIGYRQFHVIFKGTFGNIHATTFLTFYSSYFLTASYDGQIRAFDYSKKLVSSTLAHSAPITSMCVMPTTTDDSIYTIATSSHDLTCQITQINLEMPSSSKALSSLHLHTAPVSSISSNTSGTQLLTSSWDGLIGLWDTTVPSSDEVPEPTPNERDRKKRRRTENAAKPKRKAPLLVLKSHTARVSKVLFSSGSEENKAYSCGFDSTVRRWDTEYGVCEHTIVSLFFFLISLTHLHLLRRMYRKNRS